MVPLMFWARNKLEPEKARSIAITTKKRSPQPRQRIQSFRAIIRPPSCNLTLAVWSYARLPPCQARNARQGETRKTQRRKGHALVCADAGRASGARELIIAPS